MPLLQQSKQLRQWNLSLYGLSEHRCKYNHFKSFKNLPGTKFLRKVIQVFLPPLCAAWSPLLGFIFAQVELLLILKHICLSLSSFWSFHPEYKPDILYNSCSVFSAFHMSYLHANMNSINGILFIAEYKPWTFSKWLSIQKLPYHKHEASQMEIRFCMKRISSHIRPG